MNFDNNTLVETVQSVKAREKELYPPKTEQSGRSFIKNSRKHSREGGTNIGGLSESTLHLTLKYCIEPDNNYHEVYFCGCEIDVLKNDVAYEIQTKNFSALKKKLLKLPENLDITVVFPVIREKRIFWLDTANGVVSGGRKSPKKETGFMLFKELIYINEFLERKNLHFSVVHLKCDDFKVVCGKDKNQRYGTERVDRVPTELIKIENFGSAQDFFAEYLPALCGIEGEFTSRDYSGLSGIDIFYCRIALRLLSLMGYVEVVGKKERYKLYRVKKSFEKTGT